MMLVRFAKQQAKRTRAGRWLAAYFRLGVGERLANWFVHRVVQQTRGLPTSVHFSSRITGQRGLKVGRDVELSLARSPGIYIQAINGVEIGDGTLVAAGVKIISADHAPGQLARHLPAPPIRIGRRCWLGANCVILPGVELGDDVIVGAGAVVTHSFPTGSVLVGVPARLLRHTTPAPPSGEDG